MSDLPDLPTILAGDERFALLASLWVEQLEAIDPQDVLVRWIDRVDVSLLPILAEEYSLLDDGWELADSEDARRALLKGAIQIHRRKGTPWAIKTALASIGYPVLELIEQRAYHDAWIAAGGLTLDGAWLTNGAATLNPPPSSSASQLTRRSALNHWAEYAIRLNVADGAWTREQQRKIRATAERYAPARSHLVSLIAGTRASVDARIRHTRTTGRVHTRLANCRRLQPLGRRTLDGCWLIDGGTTPLTLGGQTLNGGWRVNGLHLTGIALDQGAAALSVRGRQTVRASMAGTRLRAITLGGQPASLDGGWRLSETTLAGWSLDAGITLSNATLERIALPRLDGTWPLGGEVGQPGLWFGGSLTVRRNGLTTKELI